MPRDDGEATEWLEIARSDLAAAGHLSVPGALELGVAAYLAQQSAEKALKAYLVLREQRVEKTHDLTRLVALCEAQDSGFVRFREVATRLTPYAVRYRYPGPFMPTMGEVQSAIADAASVLDWVARELEAK